MEDQFEESVVVPAMRFYDASGVELQEDTVTFLLRILIAEVYQLRMAMEED